jgi:hypothetical protein
MAKTKIARFKAREDFSAEELIAAKAAAARGEDFRIETTDYREARRVALEAAGLEPEHGDGSVPIEDMSVAEHLRRQQVPPKW